MNPTAVHFSSASSQHIPCHGEAQVETKIHRLRTAFQWNVVVADVIDPFLGRDFLAHLGLLVGCKNRKLNDTDTNKSRTAKINFTGEQICINSILQIFIIKCFRTIVFIFIAISTTFRPICPPAFFRCLSNLGTCRTSNYVLYWIKGGRLCWFR